jgi:hypothetical protein
MGGRWLSVLLAMLTLAGAALAQGPASGNSKLEIVDSPLPPATPGHAYHFQFIAHGGVPPMKWELLEGNLPTGMRLNDEGALAGTPESIGEWHFQIGVTDTSKPVQTATRNIVLKIVEPLSLEWKTPPHVSGNQILGSVVVSNGTEDTFDFTLIVMSVNEIGKAFALGYQKFALKPGTTLFEIPFGQLQNLPQGKYVVHVDGVGEVEARQAIYRRRLQTRDPLPITVGP